MSTRQPWVFGQLASLIGICWIAAAATADAQNPILTINAPATGATLSGPGQTFNVTSSQGGTIEASIAPGASAYGEAVRSFQLESGADRTLDATSVPKALADGRYTLRVDQTGAAAASVTFRVDAGEPGPLPVLNEVLPVTRARPTFSGLADTTGVDPRQVTLEVLSGSTVVRSPTAEVDDDGGFRLRLAEDLPEAQFTVRVRQADKTSTAQSFTVDGTPPVVSIDSLDQTDDRTPTFTGRAGLAPGDRREVNLTMFHSDYGVGYGPAPVADDGTWSLTIPDDEPLADNARYYVTVRQEDAVRNEGRASIGVEVGESPEPKTGVTLTAPVAPDPGR